MQPTVKVEGLDDAMRAMMAAFPKDAKTQGQIINKGIRRAAVKDLLPSIKARAMSYKDSGALAESIGVRAMPKRYVRTARAVGGMQIVPIRSNLKAMAMYINHHYTNKGRTAPAGMLLSGIRHGHLVEFGVPTRGIPARSFLWEPVPPRVSQYLITAAAEFKRDIEARVNRRAKKSFTGRAGR